MTPDAVKKSIGVLKDLAAKDEAKRAQEAAKSNLEAYIYSIREKVYEDEGIAKVTDEAMREKFSGELTDAEDWIYDGGEHATAVEFNNRRDKLQSVGDEWIQRAKELTRRPAAVDKAKDFIATARKTVEKLGETKPWIEDDAKKKMLDDVDGFESWLNEKVALQEKKKDTESAAFTAAEVTVEAKPLEAKLVRLKKTPAPKPPPPPPAPEKEETDAEAPAAAEGDAAEGEDPAAEGEEGADGATAEEGADGAEATDGGEGDHWATAMGCGGIQAPAESDLEHQQLHLLTMEVVEGGCQQLFEGRQPMAITDGAQGDQLISEGFEGDRSTVDADAFAPADQMGRGGEPAADLGPAKG